MRRRSALLPFATLVAAGFAACGLALPAFAQHAPSPTPSTSASTSASTTSAPLASASATSSGSATHAPLSGTVLRCQEQRAQPFLVRSNWFNNGADGTRMFQQSLRYRTEKYGHVSGFGRPEWNARSPRENAVSARFMGFTVQVNRRVVPALQCVEKALRESGAANDYKPHGIGGIRFHNTYRGGEVSNHLYGIAIDIDSDTNTCCGCVGAWAKHPACAKQVETIYERMSMPRSWVETFERYGWYWLGHDVLQDTMHFEFLGDPDKILAP